MDDNVADEARHSFSLAVELLIEWSIAEGDGVPATIQAFQRAVDEGPEALRELLAGTASVASLLLKELEDLTGAPRNSILKRIAVRYGEPGS
jgi:hypothetical protein